jgi:ABC transporter
MYKLSGVTKNYAKGRETVAALRGVDLVIEDGEWLAIQGPTGHGKSTLLQILGGLDRPSAGIVDFDGRDLTQLREAEVTRVRATSIGFVFQTFNLIPTLSAGERGGGAGPAARVRGGAAAAGRGRPRRRRPRRPAAARAGRAVRRLAAAGSDRPGPGQGAEGPAGRRADRQSGRGHQGRDHRPARGHVAGARPDHGAGHPRQHRGPPGPAHRRDGEGPAELPAAGPDLTAERLRPPDLEAGDSVPGRRMTNGVIRGRAAVGGCPTRDNPPAGAPGNWITYFRWLTETKLFPGACCRGTRI